MASQEEPMAKYSYTFRLQAMKLGENGLDQPSKGEIQTYINEVLGITAKRSEKDQWASV